MLRIPHCVDSRLTDGSTIDSLTLRPSLYCPENFSPSDTHFCQRLSKPEGLVRPEELGTLIRLVHLIGYRTHDLLTRSSVPLPRVP
jgi:hypothetical protein